MTVVWRKSSHSGSSSVELDCVEVASLPTGVIGIRDSKNPSGPHLAVPSKAFRTLVREIKGSHGQVAVRARRRPAGSQRPHSLANERFRR
jgi:hypothetical protein